MWKYVLKRILLALLTTFIILSLTFILMKLLPLGIPPGMDNQVYSYCNHQVFLGYMVDSPVPLEGLGKLEFFYLDSANIKHYFYQVPIMQQYFTWLKNIFFHWDWGTSLKIMANVDAMAIIGSKLPVSMSLNIISVIISVPLGILLGIVAALKKNSATDSIISTLVMVFISIPSFVMITFLLLFFGYKLGLPTLWPSQHAPTSTKIAGYIIPVAALSFGSICGYCRFTRAELCEVMSSEYLLLARTKGLTKKQAILRHALRNAMVPIIPSILGEFIAILGGSMILESIYGIPGIGGLFVDALNAKDYSVLFVDMALFTTISLFAGVLVDISYGFIDPRIRMGAKK